MVSLFQTRRRAFVALGVVLATLLLLGQLLARSRAPAPVVHAIPTAAPEPVPAPTAELVVDVVGAVRRPGLYRLPDGSRVAEAVARAGGPTAKAEIEAVNMAALLADGIQVVVPRRGQAVGAAPGGGGAAAGPVRLGSATVEQLDALPGIGPVTAQKIVDFRQEHGAFRSVDDLDAIPGIGPARVEELRDLVVP